MTRVQIVAAARAWVGTPFQHQATLKGVGCDCRGLVVGVAREAGYPVEIATNYSRYPTGQYLMDVCDAYMTRIDRDALRPGDVVAMTFESDPQHVAIVGDYPGGLSLIHSLARSGVVEHRLDSVWAGRIMQAYRIPGVE